MANKGFIKDWLGNQILPITRGELVLDKEGYMALASKLFLAGEQKDADGNLLKDAQGQLLPGLITAAERAMLSGGGTGQSLQDLYTKVSHINTGLSVAGTTVNFYTESEGTTTKTPINIVSTGDNKLALSVANNVISFGLFGIHGTDGLTASPILKSIKVDQWGRVTEVTGSALTNADIPAELSGKTIKTSTLETCVTANEDIDETNSKAIANKAYVDKKFNLINTTALGALKFGGPLSDAIGAETVVTNSKYWNHYYKVTAEFVVDADYLYSETESTVNDKTVKIGDTLIVYPISSTTAKFVHIPSGDDITSLTVKEDGAAANALTAQQGHITLQYASIFNVENTGGKVVHISLPQASPTSDGYLSSTDYNEFKAYANNLKVQYTSIVPESGAGIYSLGTLTIGTKDTTIYGKNNISKLELIDNTASTGYNPILKFTETDATDVQIVYKGVTGITVRKTDNNIEFLAANEAISQNVPGTEDSIKYITVTDGYKFGVQLGSANAAGDVTQDGLVDFRQFNTVANAVSLTNIFEPITNSLTDSTKKYHYGSTDLVAAINVTI